MTKREQIAVLTGVVYIMLMGIGMAIVSALGLSYSNPEMVRVIVFFEIIFTVLTFIVYKKLKLTALSARFQFSKWLIPFIIIFIVMLGLFLFTGSWAPHYPMITLIMLTTILVGFSEELMFRGIVLHVLLERHGVVFSIVMSAIFFALLHAVNVFAGVPIMVVPIQLLATFLFGLVFSCLAIRIRNIIPLMVYHFVWDFVLIAQSITGAQVDTVSSIGIVIELIVVIPLMVYTVKRYKVSNA